MAMIRVSILYQIGGKTTIVELPNDVESRTLIPALMGSLNLPSQTQGTPIFYKLIYTRDNQEFELEAEETLENVGIQDNDVLSLLPEIVYDYDKKESLDNEVTQERRKTVTIGVINPAETKKVTMQVPNDVPVNDLTHAIIDSMGLPLRGQDGRKLRYYLSTSDADGNLEGLAKDFTLSDNHIEDGDVLQLTVEMPAGCFPGGTKVTLSDGQQVSIETLKIGDEVLSYDTNDGILCSSRIIEIMEDIVASYLIVNDLLRITDTHLVYANGKWVRAVDLKLGHELIVPNDKKTTVESLRRKKEKVKVYNLHLASKAHTFFAENALVHNASSKAMYIGDPLEFFETGEGPKLVEERSVSEPSIVAQIQDHVTGDPLYIGEEYRLYTGVLQKPLVNLIRKPIELPNVEIVELDVSVYAQDMEISPQWSQKLHFYRDRDSGLLEFRLRPQLSGHKLIRIEFYYLRHWLQSLEVVVNVFKEKHISVTVKNGITGTNFYEGFISEEMNVEQVTQFLLAQTHIPALESGTSQIKYRLIFNGYILPQTAKLIERGIHNGAELILVAEIM